MPLWHIYHPQQTYTAEDKKAFAGKITDMYATFLPRFYVNVMFHEIEASSLYIGGEPAGDFVRFVIEHIAPPHARCRVAKAPAQSSRTDHRTLRGRARSSLGAAYRRNSDGALDSKWASPAAREFRSGGALARREQAVSLLSVGQEFTAVM